MKKCDFPSGFLQKQIVLNINILIKWIFIEILKFLLHLFSEYILTCKCEKKNVSDFAAHIFFPNNF